MFANSIYVAAIWGILLVYSSYADECSYPYRRIGKSCYLINTQKVTADTGFAICLRHGAYMANFETLEELMLMKYELKKMKTGSYFYIGGRNINRYKSGGDWRWIKHGKMTKMTYFAFDSSEPNGSFSSPEDCIFFHGARGYLFHNACCDCYAAVRELSARTM
ncbi:unnamed protein product [Mytilus coruscus]|uniref:C-type lectin domain-containing protein n=1 Tax=Mytilus coruscus TaxID=42192 RepID=A0A6J8DW50_MYTCO|nr:unnamed protein product [Mytilus coruscus]CAC5412309.1 unnamed protein product [Mytilus coruscus]